MLDKNALLQNHAITRQKNPNTYRYEWCICKIQEESLASPLVFGDSIDEAIQNFIELVEGGKTDG